LSLPPTQATLNYADGCLERINNPPKLRPLLSWGDILAEEPFEGQHWEGVFGLPPGSTVEGWEMQSLDSTPPSSPASSVGLRDIENSSSSGSPIPRDLSHAEYLPTEVTPIEDLCAHPRDLEELQARQYWRTEWRTDASLTIPFDIGDASTLGMLSVSGCESSLLEIV
jgi:gamma-tubulin complex component 5